MELYEAIHNRRSHRLYRPEMPPREALERVVDAGLWAPSGMNTQCWDIAVLAGKARDEFVGLINLSIAKLVPIMQQTGVTEKSQKRVVAFFKDLGGAPVVIAVTVWQWGDATGAANIQSGSAMMQNMLLAAHAEGLGTCWMTVGAWWKRKSWSTWVKPTSNSWPSLLSATQPKNPRWFHANRGRCTGWDFDEGVSVRL